ncbi:MAG: double zinc ribbon domain-containing protein [Candidatus Bipolaricaulia bacterium]
MITMERAAALLGELTQGALRLLYPPHCYLCGAPLEEGYLCPSCDAELPRLPLEGPLCARCGEPLADSEADLCGECANRPWFFDRAQSFGFYEDGLAELVRGLKYRGERALARPLACYLRLAGEEFLQQAEALTFVPLSPAKLRARGFNQAELLARELGRLMGLPSVAALQKIKQTEDQTELSLKERRENVRGAFAPLGEAQFERIVLIDDVYTTGATAEECSRALREGGYGEVYVLTVARARPPERGSRSQVPSSRFRNLGPMTWRKEAQDSPT